MQFIKDAKLKAGVFLRELKEKAEARKAQKALQAVNEHGHGRFFLLHVPAAATICAAVVEWYWALLFCIEATGHVDWNFETSGGTGAAWAPVWNFAFSAHWPVLVGLVCATVPIVMLSMVWLPVQFSMRGAGRWRRGTVIFVGILANILVIVSGTVVMNYNRQEQVRDALVVEQTAEAQRTMLAANAEALQRELDTLMNHRSAYVATAASVGLAAYQANYASDAAIAAERDPARRGLLTRARGAAARADELRAQIREANQAVAIAAPVAASQANVEDTVGRELNTFAQYVEVWRPPFVALICTAIGIFGAWWVLALLQGLNPRDVLRSGWADEAHRIEDKREEEAIVPQPMKPAREVVTDAETGEELVKVKPREYWRKRKGKPQKLDIQPEIPPDETGVDYDGGSRTATSAAAADVNHHADEEPDEREGQSPADVGPVNLDDGLVVAKPEPRGEQQHGDDDADRPALENVATEQNDSSEELEELTFQDDSTEDLAEPTQEPLVASEEEAPEIDQPEDHDEPREPETDPAKLIAAE